MSHWLSQSLTSAALASRIHPSPVCLARCPLLTLDAVHPVAQGLNWLSSIVCWSAPRADMARFTEFSRADPGRDRREEFFSEFWGATFNVHPTGPGVVPDWDQDRGRFRIGAAPWVVRSALRACTAPWSMVSMVPALALVRVRTWRRRCRTRRTYR